MANLLTFVEAAPPFMKNGYVFACADTRTAVLIDPGDEVDALIEVAGRERLRIEHILLTHAHLDHITGVGRARAAFAVPVRLHASDEPLYRAVVQQGLMFGLHVESQPPVDAHYAGDDDLRFGAWRVAVHHTPGHSPGGVCLELSATAGATGSHLVVGDTLFSGSIGRTDLPGGDYPALIRSIRNVLLAFPDETPVYPGHGAATTIGRERAGNPFLQE